MTERDIPLRQIIDSAVKKADKKYDAIRESHKRKQNEEKIAKELKERQENQLSRVSRLVGMRIGEKAKEIEVLKPLQYAQEKLGGLPGAEILLAVFVWNPSNLEGLVFNGYAGASLCVGKLTPKKDPYSKMRLAAYGGFFVVEGINPSGSDSHVESEIDGRLRFWQGRIYDSSREVTFPDQEGIRREKKELLDSNLKRLREKKILRDGFDLYRNALPIWPSTVTSAMISFTQGLAEFVKTVYIPPDFRQKATK